MYVLAVPNTQPSQGRAMQRGCVPATSTMHVNIRSEGPPLHYIRPFELLVFYCTPIMHSIGVGWVLAQVDALWAVSVNTVFPVVPNRMSGVPAIHESRIRFICRPSVCSYKYVPPCARRRGVSAGRRIRKESEILRTDDQCRTMPHPIRVDVIVPQQRPACELQVWIHEPLPVFKSLGALSGAEVRPRSITHKWARLMNERIPSLPKLLWTQKLGGRGNIKARVSAAACVWVRWERRGLSRRRHYPASDEDTICRFNVRRRAKVTIGTSVRRRGSLLNGSERDMS